MTRPRAADEARQIAGALSRWYFGYANEAELQAGIAEALEQTGVETRREVPLGDAGRIDFMCGRIGIEVKVAGSPAAVRRQIARYCASPDVDAVVLVTARARHKGLAPGGVLHGKPVLTLWISGLLR